MSIHFTIIPPPGLPDPNERIASFANCAGNIVTAMQEVGFVRLNELDSDYRVAEQALVALVAELDKEGSGKFSDSWCADVDLRWSGGRESREAWAKISPYVHPGMPTWMQQKESYWGRETRDRLRSDATRFLLYLRAGYAIKWN